MTEYSGIKGTRVKYVASDPTLNTTTEGQVWYNSVAGVIKALVQNKAWSSGGSMATARYGQAGAGTQTAGLAFGGVNGGAQNKTEEYMGFNFFTGGNLSTARYLLGGAGTQTAALAFGGEPPPAGLNNTEEYGGASWTSGGNLNQTRRAIAGNGLQTAALAAGGTSSPGILANTESYNGTAWTAVNSLNTARRSPTVTGTQTAALAFGGYNPPAGDVTANTESWDGTNWTAVSSMNTGVFGAGGTGTQTDTLAFGGNAPSISPGPTETTATEQYDGTNWITSPATLASKRSYMAGFGTSTAAVAAGGYTGTANSALTEEYNSSIEAVTTTAAWGSGGNYPGPVYQSGSGTNAAQTTGLSFGGYLTGSKSDATNEYNGSSWTTVNTMSDVFTGGACGGTQTAAFGAGGYAAPPSRTDATEEYDGTNWTAGGNLSVAASQNVGFGTSTAGVVYGGEGSPEPAIKTSTQEYDGSSWTTVNTMPVGAAGCGTGFGTQTAGVRSGGTAPTPNPSTWDGGPGSFSNITLLYDGTNWTAGAFSNFGGRNSTGFGVQTSGVTAGGEGSPGVPGLARTEQYDGTSWTDVATVPRTSTSYMAGFGASSGSGAIVGGVHTVVNSTDEYTGQVIANQASTLTTS